MKKQSKGSVAKISLKDKDQSKEQMAGQEKLAGINQSEKNLHIPRNVNYYSHFLQHPYITEKDIEWVLKLRNLDHSEMQDRLSRIPNQPFSLADRKTTATETAHDPRDINYKNNATNVLHLLRHRLGPTAQLGQVEFETGLRSYSSNDAGFREKERKWTTVAKKDRKDFPEFLPKFQEEQAMRKTIKELYETEQFKKKNKTPIEVAQLKNTMKITYSGFDGDQNYNPYTMKFKQKSIQQIKHLFAPGIKMSAVQWEEGLRELKDIKPPPKEPKKEELKPIAKKK